MRKQCWTVDHAQIWCSVRWRRSIWRWTQREKLRRSHRKNKRMGKRQVNNNKTPTRTKNRLFNCIGHRSYKLIYRERTSRQNSNWRNSRRKRNSFCKAASARHYTPWYRRAPHLNSQWRIEKNRRTTDWRKSGFNTKRSSSRDFPFLSWTRRSGWNRSRN